MAMAALRNRSCAGALVSGLLLKGSGLVYGLGFRVMVQGLKSLGFGVQNEGCRVELSTSAKKGQGLGFRAQYEP